MNADISEKISKWIFGVMMVLSAVVLVMFYCVGFDGMTTIAGQAYTDPANLDLLMYWMYVLVAVGIACVVIFTFLQFCAQLKNDPKSALKSLGAVVLLVALFGVAYSLADDSNMVINGKAYDVKFDLILSDVFIYVQYVLVVVTILCTLVSLLGVFKSLNKIKA